jgi:hypothetical protein
MMERETYYYTAVVTVHETFSWKVPAAKYPSHETPGEPVTHSAEYAKVVLRGKSLEELSVRVRGAMGIISTQFPDPDD